MKIKFLLFLIVANGLFERGHSAQRPTLVKEKIVNYKLIKIPSGEMMLTIPLVSYLEPRSVTKKVQIKKPYFIGKYEVTNAQWQRCFDDGACPKPAQIRPGEKKSHPAVRVNWHDAQIFARWLSKKSGKVFRLPTEDEWAYAAYSGKDHTEIQKVYDYSNVTEDTAPPKLTRKPGAFNTTDWGMSDTEGNVWEWTLTCWYASEGNTLKNHPISELQSSEYCNTRIAAGENRSHIPDFITDTYSGGCSTLKPASNIGFRLIFEEKK